MQPVRILILGTGGMAKNHAENFAAIPGVTVVAGIDTRAEQLAAFKAAHSIPHGFPSVQEAVAWGEFDAVTNVTPDAAHYATTLPFLAAGKHVLCEKPLATNAAHAEEMAAAAAKAGVVNMVNLTYRNVAQLQKAREIVTSGQIGTVRHVEASYLQSWLVSKAWGDWRTESQWLWRLSRKHGSNGVLGDIGVHILDFASYGSGLEIEHVFARLKTFDKAPGNKIGDYDLDANDSFAMTVDFNNGALGVIAVSDPLRPGAREALTELRALGVSHLALLTGDNPETAAAVAGQVGITDVRAGLLPAEKVDAVVELRDRVGAVAMVGDGVNDAPALAAASLGIAMGAAGTDAALETADIALMGDDLEAVPETVRLARRANRVIWQNIVFSIVVKAVFLVLAPLGLISLWLAVFADMGTSLLVTGNGLRLQRR